MPDGKLRHYYWRIYSFLAERIHILDVSHGAFQFPDESEVELGQRLKAVLVFCDGSRLFVRSRLDVTAKVREVDYAYVYFDPSGKRIFQYDDAPHHPDIPTHPHHLHRGEKLSQGKDKIYPLDMPCVDFFTVVSRIEQVYLQ
jgi:hypothetical protein